MWVVKLGGSLLRAAELPSWLDACAAVAPVPCLVVVGGGALADCVREAQIRWRHDDRLAHELALDTMVMNARLCQALAPALAPTSAGPELRMQRPRASLLWSPPRPWPGYPLPADWTATSDSIALWLAGAVGADALIVVKSLQDPCAGDSPAELARRGIVDAHFAALHRSYPVPLALLGRGESARLRDARESGNLMELAPRR